jgi:hypothetical protein
MIPQKKITTNFHEEVLTLKDERTEHSRKPMFTYELIEKYFYCIPQIEFFTRKINIKFDSFGNDQMKFTTKKFSSIQKKKIQKIQKENYQKIKMLKSFKESKKFIIDQSDKIYFPNEISKVKINVKKNSYNNINNTLTQMLQ